jgi:hypothetical protein
MKLQLESTPVYTHVNGRVCRVWEATTEQGQPCLFFAAHVAVPAWGDHTEFAELLPRRLHHLKGAAPETLPLELVLEHFDKKHRPASLFKPLNEEGASDA